MENALSKEELKTRRKEHEKELFIAKEDYEHSKFDLVYAIHVFNNQWSDLTMDDLDDDRRHKLSDDLNRLHDLSFEMNHRHSIVNICELQILNDDCEELLMKK